MGPITKNKDGLMNGLKDKWVYHRGSGSVFGTFSKRGWTWTGDKNVTSPGEWYYDSWDGGEKGEPDGSGYTSSYYPPYALAYWMGPSLARYPMPPPRSHGNTYILTPKGNTFTWEKFTPTYEGTDEAVAAYKIEAEKQQTAIEEAAAAKKREADAKKLTNATASAAAREARVAAERVRACASARAEVLKQCPQNAGYRTRRAKHSKRRARKSRMRKRKSYRTTN
jgi:hypothetical protein